MLICAENKIPKIWPMFGADESLDNNIRKFEQIGTHPSGNYLAIGEALTFHEGIEYDAKEPAWFPFSALGKAIGTIKRREIAYEF